MLIRLAYGFPSLAGERQATVRPLTGADEVRLAAHPDFGSEASLDVAVAATTTVAEHSVTVDDVKELSLGDRNALVLGLLAATFGSRLSWTISCGKCGERLDADVGISDLLTDIPTSVDLRTRADFRLPTPADLVAITGMDAASARDVLLARCVPGATELDEETIVAIEEAMSGADPLADIELSLGCEACGAKTNASIDLAAELTVRITPNEALLQDVHAFALAYGWSEPDVLALARPRRRQYLELIAELTP